MDLLTQDEKNSYSNALKDIHDTFGRSITVVQKVKTPKVTVNEDDFNFAYSSPGQQNDEFELSEVRQNFKARIKYIDKQDKDFAFFASTASDNINLTQDLGIIRVKVEEDAKIAIENSDFVIVDGNQTHVVFRDRPHGLFDIQFYTFYLQRTD